MAKVTGAPKEKGLRLAVPAGQDNDEPWRMGFGYDHRFGTIGFKFYLEGEQQPRAMFYTPLVELIRNLGVKPYELRALMSDRYTWTEQFPNDIEPARIRLLEETDFTGKTCIDLAGYSGEMAKIAVSRGASNVKVVDSEQWRAYGWPQPSPIDGVEFIKSDLYDWTETADVVIWYNCLYHVPDPMRALAHVRSLTKDEMLLCTLFRYMDGPWVYLYNPYECNSADPTVYMGPSIEALERMLRLTGWEAERYALTHDRCLYRCRPIPNFVNAETLHLRRVSNSVG